MVGSGNDNRAVWLCFMTVEVVVMMVITVKLSGVDVRRELRVMVIMVIVIIIKMILAVMSLLVVIMVVATIGIIVIMMMK